MAKKKLRGKLVAHQEEVKFLRMRRLKNKWVPELSRGFIKQVGEKLVQFCEVKDFALNGTQVFPVKDVYKAYSWRSSDRYYHELCQKEGITDGVDSIAKVPIEDWKMLFDWVIESDKMIRILNESPNDYFCLIGKVEKAGDKSLKIRYIDASGTWEKEVTKVKYRDITMVTIDDRYSTVFNKYAIEV